MKSLLRPLALFVLLSAMLLSFPACNRMPGDTAKLFYEEQMEKTNAFQAQHARHEEKKAAAHAEKKAEPAATPQKLVPDGK